MFSDQKLEQTSIADAKEYIEQYAGVPASLLTGETLEETIAQAKALIAYKREYATTEQKTSREQFAEWLNAQTGIEEPQDTATEAINTLEERIRVERGGFPQIADGGEVETGDGRTSKEKFAEWISNQMAYNPFRDNNGWMH